MVVGRYHRSRGRDAFGKLRGRTGFRSSRRARNHPLHPRAARPADVVGRCRRRPASALHRGPRYPEGMVGDVQVARAQCADRASARQQSQSAIDAGDTARGTASGLCAGGQVLSVGAGQFQSIARADGGFAVAGNCVRRYRLQSLYGSGAGLLHVRRLGPQSARGGIAAGARRRATLRGRGGLSGADIERGGRGDHRGLAARRDRGHQSVDRDQRQNARPPPAPAGQGLKQRQRCRRTGSGAGASQGDIAAAAQGAGAATRPSGGTVRRLCRRRTARDVPARQPAFAGRSAGEPAVAIGRATPGRARGGGTIARRQRPGRRRHRRPAAELHHQRQRRLLPIRSLPP